MFANLMPTVLRGSKVVQSFVAKNSGPILVTLGVCALSATVVSTYKAAVKAHAEVEKTKKILEDPKTDKSEENLKKIKRAAAIKVARIMAAPIIFALICAGCILGNNYIHMKRQATLAAAYALAEQNIKDYEESLEPIVGKKKAEMVREEVAHKDVERRASRNEEDVICTGHGDDLFWEPKTGHWIRANRDFITLAFNKVQQTLDGTEFISGDEQNLNDLFEYLKLPDNTETGKMFGWYPGDQVGCSLLSTGKHYWDNGKEDYYTEIKYTAKYKGKKGELV